MAEGKIGNLLILDKIFAYSGKKMYFCGRNYYDNGYNQERNRKQGNGVCAAVRFTCGFI